MQRRERSTKHILIVGFLCVAFLAMNAAAVSAAKVRVSIVSEPSGANIEWNGRFVGTTPYAADVEDFMVKAPRFLWSKFLAEGINLRIWKEGYQPKIVQMTSGPFVWTNLDRTASKVYFVISIPNVRVLLEREPGAFAPLPAAPTETRSVTRDVTPASSTVTGTGFIFASGYAATNYHVVRDATRIEVRVPGATDPKVARLVVKDARNDLAILKVEGLTAPPTPISFAEPSQTKVGQDAFTLGYPLGALMGSTVRLSTGTIDSLFGLDDDPRVYQISNPVQPDNSGGPLFNKDGQLVGIVVAQLDAKVLYEAAGIIPQNVNFAVKATFLKNLIDTLSDGGQVTRPNGLAGLARDKQVEALTPAVVEIVSRLEQPLESVVQSSPARSGPSIEGFSPEQVRATLGSPSTISNAGKWITWYYDTAQGTLKVFFVLGKATLNQP